MTVSFAETLIMIIAALIIIAIVFVIILAEKKLALKKSRIPGLVIPVGVLVIAIVLGICLNWQYAGCKIKTITQTTSDGYEMSLKLRLDRQGEVVDYNGIEVRNADGVLIDRVDFDPDPSMEDDDDCPVSGIPDRYYYNKYAEKMIDGIDFGISTGRLSLDDSINRIYYTKHMFTEKNPILSLAQMALILVSIPTGIVYAAARLAGSGKRRKDNMNNMKLMDL